MRTFVALSLLLMGWAYWILSGGGGFAPEAWPEAVAEAAVAPVAPPVVEITRADASLDDLPLAPARADPGAAPAEPLAPGAALLALAPEMAAPLLPRPEAAAAVPAGDLRVVTGDDVNLREGPGTGFAVVGRMARGERAEVIEAVDGWARVRLPSGEGWMAERFLGAEG